MALNEHGPDATNADAPSQARQHIEDLKSLCNALLEIRTLKCQRDELLAVLKAIISDGVHCDVVPHLHEKAAALIARMEEGK